MKKFLLLVPVCAALTLSGCSNMNTTQQRELSGGAIGAAAGPLGVIMGGTIGTFVGAVSIGVTGGFLGHRFGKKAGVIVDKNVFLDYKCLKCGTKFKEQHLTPAQ